MTLRSLCWRLGRDRRGLALLEFALSLPIFLTMSLLGAELTNYIVTRMRASQIALQVADNAARIGSGSQLEAKKITEADINDLLIGSGIQSGELGLLAHGRVIVSSLEPDPDNAGKFKIRWQRCAGAKTDHVSRYGDEGDNNLTGMGPAPQITAPDDGVTMFVEVYLDYQPLIKTSLSPSSVMDETASMMVRDRRDTSDGTRHPNGVYIVDGVTASTC
jgi:Flp pilus assembly protein TadG